MRAVLLATLLLLCARLPALAVQPDEVLDDPKLELRARNISAGLRCLVCQNQSIDDSDAPLARDLRLLVRERLKVGDGEAQVRDFVVARYGAFVLLKPPFNLQTALLWLSPALIVVAGAFGLLAALRRRTELPSALTPEERAVLAARLRGENG